MGQYAQNAAAVFSLNYPLVGCPKYRRPVLLAPVDRRLQALLQQKTAELGITIHRLEIMPDHVHLFVEADPTRCHDDRGQVTPAGTGGEHTLTIDNTCCR